ncbi:ATP-binding protein [Thermodesulfobacteriota bacterium B35]
MGERRGIRPGLLGAAAASLLLLAASLWLAGRLTWQRGLEDLAEDGSFRLELYVAYLQGVLEKYEGLPELLATNRRLVTFLQNPGGRERIEAFNRYLETINRISDAADTYLMDREGLTIAASNWQAERPFVGRNFSYRPYFQQAMQGRLGRYFALGTTSSRRGYYFAYPVRQGDTILGAVVIKISIDQVERDWGHENDIFLVTDPDGVIFITTRAAWRFHTLEPLADEVRQRIVTSRRYPGASLTPLPIESESGSRYGRIITLAESAEGPGRRYLLQSEFMPQAGWQVMVLSDIAAAKRRVVRALVGVGGGAATLLLLLLLVWQRRQRLAERRCHEEESRRLLLQANEDLETRVQERTAALTESNRQLRREIEERRQAEEKLRRIRRELIHAAKLAALGQMSAGINHELNQPLAAIRTYAENTVAFLRQERLDNALWNLEQIKELTERMARIGAQLKIFSRRSSGRMEDVPLHGVIDGALEILTPAIRRGDVRVDVRLIPEDLQVRADSVLLQQVLVNLVGNAVQAVTGGDRREIVIRAEQAEEGVVLRVRDSGPGIEPEHLSRIFEPFYTTKEPGQGLGLGLAISQRIIREMNGTIRVVPSRQGACFEIRLQPGKG